MSKLYSLEDNHINTILAGLRTWQAVLTGHASFNDETHYREVCDIAGEGTSQASPEDIDDICEGLNGGDLLVTRKNESYCPAPAEDFIEALITEGVTVGDLDAEVLYISTGEDAGRFPLRTLFTNLWDSVGAGDGITDYIECRSTCLLIAEGLSAAGFWSGKIGVYDVCIVPANTARTLVEGEMPHERIAERVKPIDDRDIYVVEGAVANPLMHTPSVFNYRVWLNENDEQLSDDERARLEAGEVVTIGGGAFGLFTLVLRGAK